jgi:hypothetical protein
MYPYSCGAVCAGAGAGGWVGLSAGAGVDWGAVCSGAGSGGGLGSLLPPAMTGETDSIIKASSQEDRLIIRKAA